MAFTHDRASRQPEIGDQWRSISFNAHGKAFILAVQMADTIFCETVRCADKLSVATYAEIFHADTGQLDNEVPSQMPNVLYVTCDECHALMTQSQDSR